MTIDEEILLTVARVSRCHTFIRKAKLARKYIGFEKQRARSICKECAMIGNLCVQASSKIEMIQAGLNGSLECE